MANETIPAAAVDLDAERLAAHARVNAEAEQRRLLYITAGAGQALTYQRKLDEALRLSAAMEADPQLVPAASDYPMLAATLGVDGETVVAVCAVILQRNAQFSVIGAAIERTRALANQAIEEAQTFAAVVLASQVAWPY
jgi:hypothetical protein